MPSMQGPKPLTDREYREMLRLGRRWACQTATAAECHRHESLYRRMQLVGREDA